MRGVCDKAKGIKLTWGNIHNLYKSFLERNFISWDAAHSYLYRVFTNEGKNYLLISKAIRQID